MPALAGTLIPAGSRKILLIGEPALHGSHSHPSQGASLRSSCRRTRRPLYATAHRAKSVWLHIGPLCSCCCHLGMSICPPSRH
jgi:hypothetical protein